jgi:hypothetical protein
MVDREELVDNVEVDNNVVDIAFVVDDCVVTTLFCLVVVVDNVVEVDGNNVYCFKSNFQHETMQNHKKIADLLLQSTLKCVEDNRGYTSLLHHNPTLYYIVYMYCWSTL